MEATSAWVSSPDLWDAIIEYTRRKGGHDCTSLSLVDEHDVGFEVEREVSKLFNQRCTETASFLFGCRLSSQPSEVRIPPQRNHHARKTQSPNQRTLKVLEKIEHRLSKHAGSEPLILAPEE